jgi:hypothetical protein
MKIKRWIALPLAGMAALAIGIAAVEAAPSPSPSASGTNSNGSTNYAQVFFQKLGAILGVNITSNDVKQAELQTVQQMCNDHKLTAAQCSALQAKVQNGPPFGGFGFGFRHGGPANGLMMQLRTAELNAVASALKMSTADLQNALRSGKTLSQLEQQQGVSSSAVTTAAKNAAQGVLDKAVQAGTITKAQEKKLLDAIGSGRLGGFGFGFKRGPWAPGPPPSASPGATPAAYFSTI